MRSLRLFFITISFLFLGQAFLVAQNTTTDQDAPVSDRGVTYGAEKVSKWRVGIIVKASGPCRGIAGTIPIPIQWPEQKLRVVAQDVSPSARVSYRDLGSVKQLIVKIPSLGAGKVAKALFTFEITRKEIVAPEDTSIYQIPKRVPRDIRRYLGTSPYIESRNSKIRALAKSIAKEHESAWDHAEAIYEFVRENVEYKEGEIKSAVQALKEGSGDCEELTSLFIAMCRATKIPARMVWVPDHCYPEFYLEDDEGQGHWFPCQAAGTRAFGSMPEMRPILQKGDNFKVPEKPKPQRYVAEFLKAAKAKGSPKVSFIREYVQ